MIYDGTGHKALYIGSLPIGRQLQNPPYLHKSNFELNSIKRIKKKNA